jgi:hypothetical protein
MLRPFHNGHLYSSVLAGVVNTIVIRNIRDLVSRTKTAVVIYYHILSGVIVVTNRIVYTDVVNIIGRIYILCSITDFLKSCRLYMKWKNMVEQDRP